MLDGTAVVDSSSAPVDTAFEVQTVEVLPSFELVVGRFLQV
jgi:hypothetical protein